MEDNNINSINHEHTISRYSNTNHQNVLRKESQKSITDIRKLLSKKSSRASIDFLITDILINATDKEEISQIFEILMVNKSTNKSLKDSQNNYNYIYNYLLNIMHLDSIFKEDLAFAEMSFEKLFSYFCNYMKISIATKDDLIYTIDDKNDNIYIVLEGKINLFEINIIEEKISALNYYNYLYNEYINNNKKITYTLNKTFHENKEIYPINCFSDLENFKEIIFKILLLIHVENNSDLKSIKNLYKEYHKDLDYYNFQNVIDKVTSKKVFIELLKNDITDSEMKYVNYLKNNVINPKKISSKTIKKFEYKLSKEVNKYGIFGDYKFDDAKPSKNDTAIAAANSIILIINKKAYSELIINEKKNTIEKKKEFLHNNYFLSRLQMSIFEKRLFNYFKCQVYDKGDLLFKQNEKLTNFYFVQSGKIEIIINNTNLIELTQKIELLKSKLPKFIHLDIKENYEINHPYVTVEKSLLSKRKYSIFIINDIELYGGFEFYFDMLSIYNALVASDKCIVYTLDYSIYQDLHKESYIAKEGLQKDSYKKIKNILERLIFICNSFYNKLNNEYTTKIKEEEDILHSINKNSNSHILKNNNKYYHNYNTESSSNINNNSYIKKINKNESKRNLSPLNISNENMKISYNFNNKGGISGIVNVLDKFKKRIEKGDVSYRPKYYESKDDVILPPIDDYNKRYFLNERKITSPILDNRIKSPTKLLQHVPLINKIKHSPKKSEDDEENNKELKIDIISSLSLKRKKDLQHFFKDYPGGYYLMVQQYLCGRKKKKSANKPNVALVNKSYK